MKKRVKLTASNVLTLGPGQYPDHLVPNLNLRVGKKGRTWMLRARVADKDKGFRLGHLPTLGLNDARKLASDTKLRMTLGEMPNAAPPRSLASKDTLTMRKLIDEYEAWKSVHGEFIKSLTACLKVVRSKLGERLDWPAEHFTAHDVIAVRDEIMEYGPVQANRFVAYLSPIMEWAFEEKRITVPNVVRGIKKRGKETKRERVLTTEEIVAVWKATDSPKSFHRLFRFMVLTGCRKSEGAKIVHGDIVDGVWFQADNKKSRPVRHKLCRAALDAVGTGEKGELVFPTRKRGRPISGWTTYKEQIDKASGVSDWVLHDMRRTMATHMQEMGIDPQIIMMCQNHKLQGMAAVYQRGEMLDAKHDAWGRWADKINSLVDTGGLRGQSAESSR